MIYPRHMRQCYFPRSGVPSRVVTELWRHAQDQPRPRSQPIPLTPYAHPAECNRVRTESIIKYNCPVSGLITDFLAVTATPCCCCRGKATRLHIIHHPRAQRHQARKWAHVYTLSSKHAAAHTGPILRPVQREMAPVGLRKTVSTIA